MMRDFSYLAEGFVYPQPGRVEQLRNSAESLESGAARRRFSRFVDEVAAMDLGQWEELHTRTLDLSPLFVPYVGYVVWGDNYQRGEFMALLKVAQDVAGVDPAGELPDHISVVLRLLAVSDEPIPGLLEALPAALDKMRDELRKSEKSNPYRHLLAAIAEVEVPATTGGVQ